MAGARREAASIAMPATAEATATITHELAEEADSSAMRPSVTGQAGCAAPFMGLVGRYGLAAGAQKCFKPLYAAGPYHTRTKARSIVILKILKKRFLYQILLMSL